MDRNNDGSFDIQNPPPSSEESTPIETESLLFLRSKSICRVSRHYDVNDKAYTPNLVSIGPLHHGSTGLKAMEEHKKRYLENFLRLTNVSLESYKEVVKQNETRLRACYDEPIELTSDEFVEIILVDAVFIIGFLLRLRFKKMRDDEDCIFGKSRVLQHIWVDMLLIENQIPFFILKDLFEYRITYSINHGEQVSIFELSHYFFKGLINVEVTEAKLEKICSPNIRHFVDFLRLLYLPWNEEDTGKLQKRTIPSITELHQVGVRFTVGSNKNLFDFKFKNGVLEIPKHVICVGTEISILNLLAFEQRYCKNNSISDYVFLMSRLINTEKDVDLLVKSEIVENELNSNKQESFLMRKLEEATIVDYNNFYFASLWEELNNYYRSSWHKLIADLIQNYSTTPWTTLPVFASITVIVLALIQTVCSVISAKYSSTNWQQQ